MLVRLVLHFLLALLSFRYAQLFLLPHQRVACYKPIVNTLQVDQKHISKLTYNSFSLFDINGATSLCFLSSHSIIKTWISARPKVRKHLEDTKQLINILMVAIPSSHKLEELGLGEIYKYLLISFLHWVRPCSLMAMARRRNQGQSHQCH